MAFRIGDLVLSGFVSHSSPYVVHGQLALRGCEMPFLFELTGAPGPDLRGRSFEFSVPENDREPTDEDRRRTAAFAPQQIGPTGDMTAERRVKTLACPMEEVRRLALLSQKPPTILRQCLYLEWFSQNGRVVLEALDPVIEFLEPEPEAEAIPTAPETDRTEDPDEPFPSLPKWAGDDESKLTDQTEFSTPTQELDQQLEAAARELDREIAGQSSDADDAIQEFEEFDDLLENGPEIPIRSLLTHLTLPPPGPELSEADARLALQGALGQLALFSIAFHVCDHCSIQEAYRIFEQDICAATTFMPAMNARSFVQHFTTSDFCPKCRE